MLPRLIVLALLSTTMLAQAQSDAASQARAACERKLGIPQIAGSGDPVREQQISACVQQTLREQQTPRQPRR
jgi:hypothetical protein